MTAQETTFMNDGGGLKLAPRQDRIQSLDVTRGYALFIVLLVNLFAASQPIAEFVFPGYVGGLAEGEAGPWLAMMIGFFGVGRGLFSMLFGAGMMLILESLMAKFDPKQARNVFFRRLAFLFVFGLVDLFLLLWWGDILLLYALAGVVLYFMRNIRRGWMIFWVVLFALIPTGLGVMQNGGIEYIYPEFQKILELRAGGAELNAEQQALYKDLSFLLDPAVIAKEKALMMTGSASEIYHHLAARGYEMNISMFLTFGLWDALAAMLIGIMIYKNGFLTGKKPTATYVKVAVLCLLIGLGLRSFGFVSHYMADFSGYWGLFTAGVDQITRFLIAFGMIATVNLLVKGARSGLISRGFAAIGRMALSNYLMQSTIYVVVFTAIGFGLYGQLGFMQLWLIAIGFFILQMVFSLFWLSRYRFGPFEWLWRVMTYGHKIPNQKGVD